MIGIKIQLLLALFYSKAKLRSGKISNANVRDESKKNARAQLLKVRHNLYHTSELIEVLFAF